MRPPDKVVTEEDLDRVIKALKEMRKKHDGDARLVLHAAMRQERDTERDLDLISHTTVFAETITVTLRWER